MLVVNSPWDSNVIENIPTHKESEIETILDTAKEIAKKKGTDFPPINRIEVLKKFSESIKKNIEELATLATSEGGKPMIDSLIEIKRGAEGVDTCIEILKNESGYVIPMNINKASENRIAFTQKEPIGVVLAISAFNHPFNLIIHQVIPAIAAGCPVIVKPAEDTPLSCKQIIKMLIESGLPEERCIFVMPENLELATKLVEDKRIDFFSFIGSAKVGWMLRSKLSAGTRCALEHGGLAPTFVTNTANLETASSLLARGSFYHAGQVCVSVQRIFVDKKVSEEFLSLLKNKAMKMTIGDPQEMNTDIGPLIRPGEVDRVNEWVNESLKNGANKIIGGTKNSNNAYNQTILLNPKPSDRVSRMEVFGPVVCVYTYDKIESAIKNANSVDTSFQASIFSDKINEVLSFYEKINASSVFHNDHTAFRVDWMPFAGLKHSGHGVGGIKYTMHDMQIDKMLVLKKD